MPEEDKIGTFQTANTAIRRQQTKGAASVAFSGSNIKKPYHISNILKS